MQRAAQAASIMYDELESDKLACQVPAQGQEQVQVLPTGLLCMK